MEAFFLRKVESLPLTRLGAELAFSLLPRSDGTGMRAGEAPSDSAAGSAIGVSCCSSLDEVLRSVSASKSNGFE